MTEKEKEKKKEKKEKTNSERSRRGSWRVVGTAIVLAAWGGEGGRERGEGGGRRRKVERSCSEINYAKYFPSLEYEIAPLEFLVTRGERIYFATASPADRVKNTFDTGVPPFEFLVAEDRAVNATDRRSSNRSRFSSVTKKKRDFLRNCVRLLEGKKSLEY